MREEKTLRYYLFVYLLSLGGLFVYLSFMAWRNGGYDELVFTSLLWIPIFVTLFVFVIDKVSGLFKPKKSKDRRKKYEIYLETMAEELEKEHDFLVEDFRKLKESDRFQKGLKQAYQILENGETDALNFAYIIKKYPKQSLEYIAMTTVIERTKEYMEKQNRES